MEHSGERKDKVSLYVGPEEGGKEGISEGIEVPSSATAGIADLLGTGVATMTGAADGSSDSITTVSLSSSASSVTSLSMRVGLVEMEVVGLLLEASGLGELLGIATTGELETLDGTGVLVAKALGALVGAGLCASELDA